MLQTHQYFHALVKETPLFPVMGKWLNSKNAEAIQLAEVLEEAAVDIDEPEAFQSWIDQQCKKGYAYGGYLEKRDVYAKSAVFRSSEKARNIHLGIDVWCPAKTPLFAPMAAKVVSKNNLIAKGDYGGVLILEHNIKEQIFYTLYGHLTYDSIPFNPGDQISAGEQIAELGDWSENGGWPPHLHFQIMFDLENYENDYPGVCFEDEQEKFQKNCPNPIQFLVAQA